MTRLCVFVCLCAHACVRTNYDDTEQLCVSHCCYLTCLFLYFQITASTYETGFITIRGIPGAGL